MAPARRLETTGSTPRRGPTHESPLPAFNVIRLPGDGGYIALAGMRLERLLSVELFREVAGPSAEGRDTAALCLTRWADLARTLASSPEALEGFFVLGARPSGHGWPLEVIVAYLMVGRHAQRRQAIRACADAFRNAWRILTTSLDYAELKPLEDAALLDRVAGHLRHDHVLELRRRLETVVVAHTAAERLGFLTLAEGAGPEAAIEDPGRVMHLFPWVPSDDPWRRLLEVLTSENGPSALVVHFRGWSQAPEECLRAGQAALSAAQWAAGQQVTLGLRGNAHLVRELDLLQQEALLRLSILQGDVLGLRVFLTSLSPPSHALVATTIGSIDDASVEKEQPASRLHFRSGARVLRVSPGEVLVPLDPPSLDTLFGPMEAASALRTPMPAATDLPGLPLNRARTAPIVGVSGEDCPLGINVHRGFRQSVALDGAIRFRHTYVVGQTGTGKSTLLLHMILSDLEKGRGVAVLDPHGTLIRQVLGHFPRERADDLVLLDPADTAQPVGFNLLRILETEPQTYRQARDIVIDDLYAYLDQAYDMRVAGGPMFETQFRGMLRLLLGEEPQDPSNAPNLLLLRRLYQDTELRRRLVARVDQREPLLGDFVREAEATTGDTSLKNMAPYVTSKFNRFLFDSALQNITCQNRILDIEDIVNNGKVLLFDLGKGRFGEQAAGLLASQLVSRLRLAVMKRGAAAGAAPFYLYADEFQLFADQRFAELLAEARKFGLALTLAHQFAKQLPPRVLEAVVGNVGTTVLFRLGATDAEAFRPSFTPTFTDRDLSSLPNFRACVRSSGDLGSAPFSIELPPPLGGGDDAWEGELRERSRRTHGRPRDEVEQEIRATHANFGRAM